MSRLDKDMVADASICNLLMRVGSDRVDVVVYSVVADNGLIYRSLPLPAHVEFVKAVEDVIYDNPLLLSDFRKIYILVETPDYMMYPQELDPDSANTAFSVIHPTLRGKVSVAPTATKNAWVAYSVLPDLLGFFTRTFPQAEVSPHILPLLRYFASHSAHGNSRRMICNFRQSSVDVIVLDGNKLLHANTFAVGNFMDAVYYILAVRMAHGLDPLADEILLAGDRPLREQVTPVLRTYVSKVMPVIFPPQMFRAGKESMMSPFDLIVTPLCV